ncbi:MAG TPA: class I SAM-dependent methyltransferase, partial [Clostridiales bacterium]|nr:class I SAM-dependent methyltransferase [Clostridiales bacterium]
IIKSSIQKGIKTALEKQSDTISFVKAFANDTTLEDNIADVVVCSQSFHWMEPAETLAEINRILKKGGIFAAIDCDWPPVCNRQAEEAYNQLSEKVTELSVVCKENDSYHWDK